MNDFFYLSPFFKIENKAITLSGCLVVWLFGYLVVWLSGGLSGRQYPYIFFLFIDIFSITVFTAYNRGLDR